MKFIKYTPWALCVVLIVLLAFVYLKKNSEIESLHNQYNQLVIESNKKLEETNKQQQKLVEEANQKQQQLAEKATQLLTAASLPEATVAVSFRPAMLGNGFVAGITNISSSSAPFSVEIRRPSTEQSRSYDFVIDAGRRIEIGHREGWAFVSGDSITIKQPNHKPKSVRLS